MTDYGLFCFDSGGNQIDLNLESSLVVEGILYLGNAETGMVPIDMLFPRRHFFKGIFLMPQSHSNGPADVEHLSPVYIKNGMLCWAHNFYHSRNWPDMYFGGGAFAGRNLLYGYFN
ncbi:hypothetical protein [Neisseria sp. P0008.S004]|uniref:hypothetical protein n=1 Tax=Neisseria sp. P0008.S004 TaxID=3436701 RepID=UPI003F808033